MRTDYRDIEIYTIGHGKSDADEIVSLLAQNGVRLVADVRSVPYSQYVPQFNRETFSQVLRKAGIRYAFAGESLGGRPKDPTCYKDGQLPSGKADYLHLVDYDQVAQRPWYQKGIEHLIELARLDRVAIMCSEEDPDRCHRQHLIVRTLLGLNIVVWHIRADGNLQRARFSEPEQESEALQMALFATE